MAEAIAMNAIAEHDAGGAIAAQARARNGDGAIRAALKGLARRRRLIAATALAFPLAFYALLLTALVIRFGHLPNYVTPYDWFGNVARIIHGTKSIRDMVPIILDEWLVEIGYMDFDYGHGIAEWSLSIVPHKFAILVMIGALGGVNMALLLDQKPSRTMTRQCATAARSGILASMGTLCASLTSVTLFSVACCATPSWVASLTILGLATSTAFALEPFGTVAALAGITALVISALLIIRDGRAETATDVVRPATETAPC
jgi:hypothetical protein